MADEVSGTINVEVLYKAAGGGGGGGITGASKASGSTAASAKKHSKYMFDVTKALKTISGAVTIGAVIKQSKITSSFLGTFFQLMGALVDIFLMPFLPLLIPVMKGMAGLAQWLMRFMDNPGAAIKEALIAIKDLVQDASKGFLAIFTDWDATKDFLGSISLKDIANNALRIGLGGAGLVGLFAASSAIGNVQELLMSKFFGFNPLKKALFTTTDLMLKLFGKSGKIKSMLEALRMWSQPSSVGKPLPNRVPGKGIPSKCPPTTPKGGRPPLGRGPRVIPVDDPNLNPDGSRKRGGTPDPNRDMRSPLDVPGGRGAPPVVPPPTSKFAKFAKFAKFGKFAAVLPRALVLGMGLWPYIIYTVMKASEEPEWVRPRGWTPDLEKLAVYGRSLPENERLKLAGLMQNVPFAEQASWAKKYMDGTLESDVPIAPVMPANNRFSGARGRDTESTGNDLDILITKGENGEWVVEADSNSSFGNFVSQMN